MNDALRLVFIGLLAYSLLVLWQKWEKWPPNQNSDSSASVSQNSSNSAPTSSGDSNADSDSADAPPKPTQSLRAASGAVSSTADVVDVADTGNLITVETDWLEAVIAENGGDIIRLNLKKHEDTDGEPFALFERGTRQHDVQSGLIGGEEFPDHRAVYTLINSAAGYHQTLTDDLLSVALRSEAGGVVLIKKYVFRRGSYIIEESLEVENNSGVPISPLAYFQLSHNGAPPEAESSFLPAFFGGVVFTNEEKFIKTEISDIGDTAYPRKSQDGWIGMIQRYFAAVWIPPENAEREYFMRRSDNGARLGFIAPFDEIASGQKAVITARLFAGAQEQNLLNDMNESGTAPGIHLVVDYGWLTVIAVLLFKLLAWIQQFVGNWGLSVILLTFLVKLAFYPLASISYRSLARMKEISPRIKGLQETYGDDKQQMQKALLALYREKKINPLGGCLPILAQIPVFIALYWVILGSVELRNAPFYGWITDLSAADPYFILPICMGAAMVLQMRMSPTPPDPTQAMIVKVMPLFFAVFSLFFPAGLVLYWLVNTLLSIAQQWHITRSIARASG